MDFRLDSDGDLDIEEGNLVRITGDEEVAQRLRQRLRHFYGEWFLDKSKGVPYREAILLKNPKPSVVDALLKKQILQTPGVTELLEFSLELDTATRDLQLSFRVKAVEGEIEISEGIP